MNVQNYKEKAKKIQKGIDRKVSALRILQQLNGKQVTSLSKKEYDALLIAIGQLVGVINDSGVIEI